MNKDRQNERGSVLVFILIGIVLFAALSYTVTQSMRVNSGDQGVAMGNREKANVAITDIMQFLEALKMRVFVMTSTGNVPEAMLDFRNDVYLLPNGNAITGNINGLCSDNTCRVFAPYAPTGVTPMTFPSLVDSPAQVSLLYPQNGHGRVGEIDIKGIGTSAPDLVFVIYGVKPQICNTYNQKQGITTNYTSATTATSISENGVNSTPDQFNGYTTTRSFAYNATDFAGKKSFCAPAVADANEPRLGIWHVLKAR